MAVALILIIAAHPHHQTIQHHITPQKTLRHTHYHTTHIIIPHHHTHIHTTSHTTHHTPLHITHHIHTTSHTTPHTTPHTTTTTPLHRHHTPHTICTPPLHVSTHSTGSSLSRTRRQTDAHTHRHAHTHKYTHTHIFSSPCNLLPVRALFSVFNNHHSLMGAFVCCLGWGFVCFLFVLTFFCIVLHSPRTLLNAK